MSLGVKGVTRNSKSLVWGEADLREWRPDLAAPRGTVLDPFKVDGAEGRQREARQAKVIVLIHTQ